MANGPLELFLGDEVRLRKPHPGGSHEWTSVGRGAGSGVRCHGCCHRGLLRRTRVVKRLSTCVYR
ncbi:MAG: DUF951 family protein, partial [Chloroflexota bacterium]